jgi:diguanylate cyclase (GGDEF)-like protein/PAS domain S-box-containing protein
MILDKEITERTMAEKALSISQERYALAAKGANDGLWDWDMITNTVYFSTRWKSMLGYTDLEIGSNPEEWLGRIYGDDRKQVEAQMNAHIRDKRENFECEYRIRHSDGTYRWVLSRGLAIIDEAGIAHRMAGSQTDIAARKIVEEQLLHDAFHDALTGLPNRALFMDRLAHVINSSKRRKDSIYAVLFIDVDRFKDINDSLGHLIGDKLLIEAAKRFLLILRPEDTVARFGGDEFAVILENIKEDKDVSDVADRIQKGFSPAFVIDNHEIRVSLSTGIALKSFEYEKPEHVLRDADIAMYQAKAKGKDRYEFFESIMHSSIIERLQLEADLRRAIENGQELVMYYQPIITLKTHKLVGFEALIRWIHPKRGLIAPMEFIPLAEETGLIHALGEFVIREVAGQLLEWQKKFVTSPPLRMSFNVSSKQFMDPHFADNLRNILNEIGVNPDSLAIEITETIIMQNTETAILNIEKLRAMGVHIHIDDFGTGYSSLSYLHHFPVHALKIDRSFIERMSNSNEDQEIVKTIVMLAQNLNMEVIAEGIELTEQLSKIKLMDCHYAQGFLFSRPMASKDIEERIQKNKLFFM